MERTPSDLIAGSSWPGRKLLSVVVPAYNEQEVVAAFHKRLSGALDSVAMDAEVIYVNDGSADNTLAILHELRESESTGRLR